jgi:hypothetical protein
VTSKRCRASKEGPLGGLGTGIKSFQPARKEGRATGKVGAAGGGPERAGLLAHSLSLSAEQAEAHWGEALPVCGAAF